MSSPSSGASLHKPLNTAPYFLWFCKIPLRQTRVANLTAVRHKVKELLEYKWWGVSRCETSLWQALCKTVLFAKGDHIFSPWNMCWHKFAGKTGSLRSTPFVQRCVYFFFLLGEWARIEGIFITLEWFDLSFFRHAMVRSIDTAAVCEVTGDAEFKRIFWAHPSPFFSHPCSTSSTHLSLFLKHCSLLFEGQHIELCPLPFLQSPCLQVITSYVLSSPYLAISPFYLTFFTPLHVAPLYIVIASFSPPCNSKWS